MTDAQSTLTRATTASRKSTIASRNASLIKKNTGPLELRPSDILIERFSGTCCDDDGRTNTRQAGRTSLRC